MKRWICLLFCLLLTTGIAAAEDMREMLDEQITAAGGDELYSSLPEETKRFLRGIGIDSVDSLYVDNGAENRFEEIVQWAGEVLRGPLSKGCALLAVVILCAFTDSLRQSGTDRAVSAVFQVVSTLAVAISLIPALTEAAELSARALESLSVFMLSFVPVYGALLCSSGRTFSAAGYQSVVLLAAQIFSAANGRVLLPLATASCGLGVAGSVNRDVRLDALAAAFNKFCVWSLGSISALFVGMLSVKNVIAAASDSVGKRVLRLSVASFIPVVGGALSESVNTVAGCLTLTRSTVGAFGIAATAGLLLPPMMTLCGWMLLLGGLSAVTQTLATDALSVMLKSAAGLVRVLLAMLCIEGLFMIVTVALVTMIGGVAS